MNVNTSDPELTFAEVQVEVDGKEYFARVVNYGDSINRGEVRGNHQMARGMTDGEYSTDDGSIELYRADFDELQDTLGADFYRKRFTVKVSYAKDAKAAKTDELVGCVFTKRSANMQGSDALTVPVGLKPHYIRWNGKDPLPNMPQGTGSGTK